jgi:tetratricopeptide (TPR) repeat protein
MGSEKGTRKSPPLFPVVILLMLSFAVYANTIANGFVYDDTTQVLENRWIRYVGYLPDIFSRSVWSFLGEGTYNYYRPIMNVIYMANYHVSSTTENPVHTGTGLYSVGTIGRNAVWKNDLTLFTDTVKKSPDAAAPHQELGIALAERGRVEEAIASYDRAIAMASSDFRMYNNRGLAFNQMGRLDLAMADFDRAIAWNPRSCEAYNNKGKVYGQTGSFDKAIEHFSKAIDIHPDFPLAYGNRGLAYSILGDYPKAWKDVNRAIELDEPCRELTSLPGERRTA